MHGAQSLSATLELISDNDTTHFSTIGSSTFLRSSDGRLLFKFVADKYHWRTHFWRWLGRDVLSKRLVGRYDARHESKSARILAALGQATVKSHGYGCSLNPLNVLSSVYVLEFITAATSGRHHFHRLAEPARQAFIAEMMKQAVALAQHGYLHRDFHLDNLLIDPQGAIIWIDTHLRKLPANAHKRARLLAASISPTKLDGEVYAAQALDILAAYFPEVTQYRKA